MPRDSAFPPGFLWGTATSSHQVEGDNTNNDWFEWEQGVGHIHDNSTSGQAAQWWEGRAEKDLQLAASLGQNAHRLSLEWSRIMPSPDEISKTACERYRQIFDAARASGLELVVTLNHFTLPRWLAERGGWTWDGMPESFARYAALCAREFGDHVGLWLTVNEPSILAFAAYADRRWPPGAGKLSAGMKAMSALLQGHAEAFRSIKRVLAKARVGIALNMPLFEPAEASSPADRLAASFQDWMISGAILESFRTGRLAVPLSTFSRTAVDLSGVLDFVGLNYYGRYLVRFDVRSPTPLGRHVQPNTVSTPTNDWGQPHAEGMIRQLARLRRLDVPIYVTENGIFDNDDTRRPEFLSEHVRAIAEAIERGVDVRGYFHWTLIDNFEWAEGWATHFGLIELDRETQERTPRASAKVYEAICRSNGAAAME